MSSEQQKDEKALTPAAASTVKKAEGEKEMNPQQIVEGFRKLREEQQLIASKISELEAEKNEHKLVADTLQSINPDRNCYRLIGGVLVERTVQEVLPALTQNAEKLETLIASLNETMVKKGKDINEYREKYNIRFMNEMEASKEKGSDDPNKANKSEEKKSGAGGILVG
uniref:Prefoldin subunit 2 n=1 Tax=Plectus sambesii TaxID=2011161 RepID=A0A914WZF2_9BILA